MGYLVDFSERSDVRRFDEGLKKAKHGLMEVCDIWEDMKQDFSERGGYGERGSYRERYSSRGYGERRGYSSRDWDDMDERRYRDSRGRYM